MLMKKILRILLLAAVAIYLLAFPVLGANNVSEIDIEVILRPDGSAYIVQNWRGTFEEGTENYIPIRTDGIAIRDLTVSDIDGSYTLVPQWDVDWSFEEKARKCGILETKDGVELCFGITQYGENRYAIEYVVEDFIKAYQDYDGTNFMLVNRNMNTFPSDCHVSIVMADGTALNETNTGIWAFGYEGQIEFLDGTVNAYTTRALEDDNCFIVMLRLDKGILSPNAYVDTSFDEVKEEAFKGSDYQETITFGEKLLIGTVISIAVGVPVVAIIFLSIRAVERKKFIKATRYYRQIPNEGNLSLCYFLARNFYLITDKTLIIGATMLDMMNRGEIAPITEENIGIFGKIKESVSIRLIRQPADPVCANLYAILESAAGVDGILQEKELEKYTYRNYSALDRFMELARMQGSRSFSANGGFLGRPSSRITHLSDTGKNALGQVVGFKKYLQEFSLIDERELQELSVWKSFMVFAMLLGIADQVEKQLKKLYPNSAQELSTLNRHVIICHSYHRTMYRSYQSARSGGSGGHSSIGGGGGFSGGGFGGGSR